MLSDFLRVGVLSSKRAPGLDGLLHHPFRGKSFDIECVVSSDSHFGECGVPVITHPIRAFYDERQTPIRDRRVRATYDEQTAELFRRIGVDIILLLGYLYVVTDELLGAFPGRVINIHDGTSKYPGLHATRDAILAGESATFSMVHHVTPDIDAGPVIAMSHPFAVAPFVLDAAASGEHDVVRAYAYAHREWMMRSTWGSLAVRALEQVAALEVA
jgi:phosphoribosylglycinamide formyltransferase-1